MQIRLDQILDEPFDWSEPQEISPEVLEHPDLVGLGELEWGGRVSAVSGGHLFRAHLEYEQTLSCPRCLAPSAQPVSCEVELLLVRGERPPAEAERELEDSELSVLFLDGDVIDTQPLLLEQLELNIPMRALCREECAGLCPGCGANRNLESCDCETGSDDPRWSALAGLKDRMDDRDGT